MKPVVRVARYAPAIEGWPAGIPLRIAMLTDFHCCEPFMDARRVAAVCAQANALAPDLIVLLGDYLSGPRFSTPPSGSWAAPLKALSAPLGVHAVLGNHDYNDQPRGEPTAVERALGAVGIPVYINRAVRIEHAGHRFWLAGLGDQYAYLPHGSAQQAGHGVDDLPAVLAQITTDEPLLLMAHEPDIFADLPSRVALTMSGHTHAGQVRLFGHAPVVPSRFGRRFLHGHMVEAGRHLIVSSGLGYSGLPVRFGAPPEIVVVELAGEPRP
ncbi:MAG: metallophosphoesterase [Devosia sp.]|nr:metallophosphoesterase [Devosia sp.]